MKHQKNRNEVNLDDETIEILTKMASKHKWKLKLYMESLLTMHASRFRSKILLGSQQQTEKVQGRK